MNLFLKIPLWTVALFVVEVELVLEFQRQEIAETNVCKYGNNPLLPRRELTNIFNIHVTLSDGVLHII